MSIQDDHRASTGAQTHDPAAEFALKLRELRSRAGCPSFRQLAKATNYSSSALAAATSGKRLPSQAIVRAFATGCGADPDDWAALLHQAVQTSAQPVIPVPPAVGDEAVSVRPGWGRRIMVAAGGLVLLGAGVLIGIAVRPGPVPPAESGHLAAGRAAVPRAVDGADPVAARCTRDAQLVRSAPIRAGGRQIGVLELLYSPQCAAGWARIYLEPGEPGMLGEVTVQAADGRLAAFAYFLSGQMPAYTDVITPGKGRCLAAQAVFHPAGHSPAITAIGCQSPAA